MKGLITSQYNGQELSFSEQGWFNATQAASRFNKKPNDWLFNLYFIYLLQKRSLITLKALLSKGLY